MANKDLYSNRVMTANGQYQVYLDPQGVQIKDKTINRQFSLSPYVGEDGKWHYGAYGPYNLDEYVPDDYTPFVAHCKLNPIRSLLGIPATDGSLDPTDDNNWKVIADSYPQQCYNFNLWYMQGWAPQVYGVPYGTLLRADFCFYLTDTFTDKGYAKHPKEWTTESFWSNQWENRTSELYRIIEYFKATLSSHGLNIDVKSVYNVLQRLTYPNQLFMGFNSDTLYKDVKNDNYVQYIRVYFTLLDPNETKITFDGYKITEGKAYSCNKGMWNGDPSGMWSQLLSPNHYCANYSTDKLKWALRPGNDEIEVDDEINYDVTKHFAANLDKTQVYSLSELEGNGSYNLYQKIANKSWSINCPNSLSNYDPNSPVNIPNTPQDYQNIWCVDGTKYLDAGCWDFVIDETQEVAMYYATSQEYSAHLIPQVIVNTADEKPGYVYNIDGDPNCYEVNGIRRWARRYSNIIFGALAPNPNEWWLQKEIYAYCPEADLNPSITNYAEASITFGVKGQNIGRYNLETASTMRRYS